MKPAPTFRMFTHIARITPLDPEADDGEHGFAPSYETPAALAGRRTYLAVVRQRGQTPDEDGVIYSDGSASVVIHSTANPDLKSNALVEWGWRPAGFPDPAPGSSGVETPIGWVPKQVGYATADASSWASPATWRVDVLAKT